MSSARGAIAGERGLTLAEILVALAVIGVGLVGLAAVIPVSAAGVQEGGQLSTATFLAEQMLERARAAAWTTQPALDCLGVSAGDAAPRPSETACPGQTASRFSDETRVAGHPGYERVVRVEDCTMTPGCAGIVGDGLRRVTVIVRPSSPPGARAVRLEWLASRK